MRHAPNALAKSDERRQLICCTQVTMRVLATTAKVCPTALQCARQANRQPECKE